MSGRCINDDTFQYTVLANHEPHQGFALLAAPLFWIAWRSRYLPSWLLVPGNVTLVSAPLALLVAAFSFARLAESEIPAPCPS